MKQGFRFSSSFRAERLEITVAHARTLARDLGISRVTDITRLDCVGVPVVASIRPNASPGSLCVNAGKGITIEEARAGAYMEAIEYAFAEFNRACLKLFVAPARQVFQGPTRPDSILDFCPVMNTQIDLDEAVVCVKATDIQTGDTFLVPAELVFLPMPVELAGKRYFGCNSNGLCSGNSVNEATVHGLAELIERDICSFQSINDTSRLVTCRSLPANIRSIESKLSAVGMKLYVRSCENIFGMPYFMAAVAETEAPDPIYISIGYGCHPCKDIAATRAVCEALQSRLSFIHGGRDDLTRRYKRFASWSPKARLAYARKLLTKISRNGISVNFMDIPDYSREAKTIDSALRVLINVLERNGFTHLLRVVYTPSECPLKVIRIMVPRLECFTETTGRVGFRLRDYVREL